MDAPFDICETCGTPKLNNAHALVLYFRTEKDRADFTIVVQQEMLDVMTYSVGDKYGC